MNKIWKFIIMKKNKLSSSLFKIFHDICFNSYNSFFFPFELYTYFLAQAEFSLVHEKDINIFNVENKIIKK